MGNRKRLALLFKTKRKEESFLQNGSILLQDQFASCNGRSCPIYGYSVQDLISSTNNFDKHQPLYSGLWCKIYKGFFKNRPFLIKMLARKEPISGPIDAVMRVHDIAITAQLSKHKNILRLIGCCLELQRPALVYEYKGYKRLSDLLCKRNDNGLSWRSRVRIAKDIANAATYLHTAFSTPIIHANLSSKKVIINQYGVAKLFDFSLSISLQPGESHAKDVGVGCMGVFTNPEYQKKGIATTKIDVHSFGLILLIILTGEQMIGGSAGNLLYTNDQGKRYIDEDHLEKIIDSRILEGEAAAQREEQFQAFFKLALRCVQDKGERRPEMIEVAKELRRIEMEVGSSSCQSIRVDS